MYANVLLAQCWRLAYCHGECSDLQHKPLTQLCFLLVMSRKGCCCHLLLWELVLINAALGPLAPIGYLGAKQMFP